LQAAKISLFLNHTITILRDPSLHIRKSDLIRVLNDIKYTSRTTGADLVKDIFNDGQDYQITDRYLEILESKSKAKKKIKKSQKADKGVPNRTVEHFNKCLNNFLKGDNFYRKQNLITKEHKDYILLKEIAKNAYEFTTLFDIDSQKEGFDEYIKLGYSMMRKYSLNRFKYYDTKIHEAFENKLAVLTDNDRASTLEFYNLWKEVMVEYSGMDEFIDLLDDYSKFYFMVVGRQQADENRAPYDEWIVAQFEGLSFLNVLPELAQFSGEGAKDRYVKMKRNLNSNSKDSITDLYD